MVIIKSYTDLEQSKKLAEILPIESADMYYEDDISVEFGHGWHSQHIPCWSFTALLDALPYYPSLHRTVSGWRCDIYDEKGYILHFGETSDNPVDTCYEMILKLHEGAKELVK